jgi:hypothetical protein
MKNLSEKAVLVNLKVRIWSGKKDDRKIANDIEVQHQARNAGRYKKNLIDDTELREVYNQAQTVRKFVKEQTLPWGDNGSRILPAIHHMGFMRDFQEKQFEFEDAVAKFIRAYPARVREAPCRLNGLYRQTDYPPTKSIHKKFQLKLDCEAIADLEDFRLQVDEQEVSRLREEMQKDYADKIADATKDIWARIKDTVGHMVEKLTDQKARFHDSLVNNIRELVGLLPKLNITADKDIDLAVTDMKKLLVDPDNLRSNKRFRSQTAKEAKAILDKFGSYM